jgi:ParB family chromosome partitioning protein
MEAIAALGGRAVPAIITDAPLKDRYLMSLVENIARKRPPLSDLVKEVRSLKKRYKNSVIAEKLGMGHTYVDGIVHLLQHGEDRLVEQVEAGTVPLSIAIKIATAGSIEVQRAMSEAYEKGELRGAKLVTVQRLIARRSSQQRQSDPAERPSTKDLARAYERHTLKQRAMVRRASIVRERLALLRAALKRLLADQEFVRLLRSEGLDTIPEQVASHIQ